MDEIIRIVYSCYLGKELLYRAACIVDFVREKEGKSFFNLYSSDTDSIIDFIKRCEAEDLL